MSGMMTLPSLLALLQSQQKRTGGLAPSPQLGGAASGSSPQLPVHQAVSQGAGALVPQAPSMTPNEAPNMMQSLGGFPAVMASTNQSNAMAPQPHHAAAATQGGGNFSGLLANLLHGYNPNGTAASWGAMPGLVDQAQGAINSGAAGM